MPYPTSERYPSALRAGGVQYTVCDAYYNGSPLPGGQNIPVTAGSITDTSTPGVRRQLDITFPPVPGLFDLLSPFGTQLRPRSVLRYPSGFTEQVPMGVFGVDSTKLGYGSGGQLSCASSDKWADIQRATFLAPTPSVPGSLIVDQIAILIRGALGPGEPVNIFSTSLAEVGWLVWEDDRAKAINDLAESIGAAVFFDRNGVATIADIPTTAGVPVWTVDASASGILLDADRSRTRAKTYNVVLVNSEKADGTVLFDTVRVWDATPASVTYAGADPFAPGNVPGPFGVVPYSYTSPLLRDATQALGAASTLLARVTGLSAQLSLSAVRNPALDVFDTITVQLPRERYDIPRAVERHVVDRITHPLMPDGVQQIDTRSQGGAA